MSEHEAVHERAELEQLLARDPAAEARRAAGLFDALAAPHADRIVLYGAGNLGVKVAEGLRALGVEPLAFADGNPALAGTKRAGLTVLSRTDAAARFGRSAAFVPSIWNRGQNHAAIVEGLRALGCETVVPLSALFWKYPKAFLPYYQIDLPQNVIRDADRVRRGFALLGDDESRRAFVQVIGWSLDLRFPAAPPRPMTDQYFPSELRSVPPDEVLVDVGAYDGDTVQAFVARVGTRFKRLVALEPDPGNFAKLEALVRALPEDVRSRIQVRRVGASASAGRISFQCDGSSSSGAVDLSRATVEVEVVALDDLPLDDRPTYVKMDVEGMELDALRGARRLVREAGPALAICVYHRLEHLWEVPLLVEELRPGYAFHLRRYAEFPWENVCYAIPRGR